MSDTQFTTFNAAGCVTRLIDAGQGPAVLLCHGFPETLHSWRHQVRALVAAGYRCLVPQLRGYAGSASPAAIDQYSVFDLIGDMVGVLDACSVNDAVIVGNDWGATVAWNAALARPDRFRAVAALGVPMMGRAPRAPTQLFPQTADAMFYTLYFQEPEIAERELEHDVRASLIKILWAASAEAGPRQAGDETPNPFGMVSRSAGLLGDLPLPARLPPWLAESDLDCYAADFSESGFRGPLNYYRNLDRNWELQRCLANRKVEVPALYMVGDRDPGLAIPGMDQIIAGMKQLVPDLRESITVSHCGHWLPQEKPVDLNAALLTFLGNL